MVPLFPHTRYFYTHQKLTHQHYFISLSPGSFPTKGKHKKTKYHIPIFKFQTLQREMNVIQKGITKKNTILIITRQRQGERPWRKIHQPLAFSHLQKQLEKRKSNFKCSFLFLSLWRKECRSILYSSWVSHQQYCCSVELQKLPSTQNGKLEKEDKDMVRREISKTNVRNR